MDHNDVVDTVYYEYELSADQAKKKFGDRLPERPSRAIENGRGMDKFPFLHCVKPNQLMDSSRADAIGSPFVGYHISLDDDEIIPTEDGKEFDGFDEQPYIWSRYTVNPMEKYGRGPGMMALPDVQTLQEMQKTFMRSGHKVADPPLLVAADGLLAQLAARGYTVTRP